MQALRNKNKAIKPQKKPKSPCLKPNVKVANINCQNCKYQGQKLQILKEEGRIDFYSTLNTCRMRIKAKEGECKDEIRFKRVWDLGNLLPKLSRNPKIKSQDAASRKKRPDRRTRGSHAPKRVAICHYQAAETRLGSRSGNIFRGGVVLGLYYLLHL